MGSLFSSESKKNSNKSKSTSSKAKAAASVTDKDRAILDLKNARDRLKKYRKKMEADASKLTEQAKLLIVQKQKDRALLLLKLKRMKEKEVDKADKELLTVLETIDKVEWESINMDVMKALKSGTTALNKMHEEMSVDDVAALLEETNEAIEVENQINNLLAGQLDNFDDAELEQELAALIGEPQPAPAVAMTPSAQKQVIDMPNAPSHEIRNANTTAASTEVEDDNRVLANAI